MNKKLLVAATFCLACGGSGGVETITETISAAEGGSVSLEGSVLDIPPSALGTDTAITLQVDDLGDFAALENAESQVLTILPAMSLEIPATLTLDLAGTIETDESASVFQWTDGVWLQLASNIGETGLVETTVNNLSSYTVVKTSADTGSGGVIVGTLVWAGAPDTPVENAPIELSRDGILVAETTSDANGKFTFSELAAGQYSIRIDYECLLEQDVTVNDQSPTALDLQLCQF